MDEIDALFEDLECQGSSTSETIVSIYAPITLGVTLEDIENFTDQQAILYNCIDLLANHINPLVKASLTQAEPFDLQTKRELRKLLDIWVKSFVLQLPILNEVREIKFDPSLFGFDAQGKPKRARENMAAPIILEILRLHYLTRVDDIREQEEHILESFGLHSLDTYEYDCAVFLQQCKDPLWKRCHFRHLETPILSLNQSQVVDLIYDLTFLLHSVPLECGEYWRIVDLALYRLACLLIQAHPCDVLDMAEFHKKVNTTHFMFNRDFLMWISFYGGTLFRAHYNFSLVAPNRMLLESDRIELWTLCTQSFFVGILERLPDESFEDLWFAVSQIAYTFPGDDLYFMYQYPNKIHSRAACLTWMRPHLKNSFFGQSTVTKQMVLARLVEQDFSDRPTYLFCYWLLDDYLKPFHIRSWLDSVVVLDDAIESAAFALQSNHAPLILQVQRGLLAYDRACIFKDTDNPFTNIAIWFYLLATRYQNTLHGVNLSRISNQIVSFSDQQVLAEDNVIGEL